jgi:hypothetical protein
MHQKLEQDPQSEYPVARNLDTLLVAKILCESTQQAHQTQSVYYGCERDNENEGAVVKFHAVALNLNMETSPEKRGIYMVRDYGKR